MSSELPSQPAPPAKGPLDAPIDAVVIEVPPVVAAEQHPYTKVSDNFIAWHSPGAMHPPPNASPFFPNLPVEYVVPQRFGMSAILGIMTALSLLFGGLYWAEAWPVFYAFTSAQVLIVCLVQMFYGRTPRAASAIAGAVLAPLFMLLTAWFSGDDIPVEAVLCLMFFLVPFGAFLGYLTGTCAAGVFLVMDKLEPYLQGQRPT